MPNRQDHRRTIPQGYWRRQALRRRPALLLLILIAAAAISFSAPVHSDRWLNDAKYLSSDDLKGRGDGTPELDKAADYIADQFRKTGLDPLPGGFFQAFTATVGSEMGKDNQLLETAPKSQSYHLKQDFLPLTFSATGEPSGGVAFVGYGITAPEYNYDDYKGIDVSGKIALALRHEPQENDDNSIFRGRQMTRHAEFATKAINARAHGAIALLVVNDPVNHSGSDDQLVPFGAAAGPNDVGIPVLQVKQTAVNGWMKETGQSLEQLQKSIDRDLTNHSFRLPANFRLTIHTDVHQKREKLKNVVGVLRGSDPKLRDQYIVIGGHYDHLGDGSQGGSLAPSEIGEIHHGADDNASGTAGVMELARMLEPERDHLRRSILFMTFAGEELGLLGSAHYVEDPMVPLDNTIAMLNLDMIGRVNNNKLFVGGVGTSPIFRKLVEEENSQSSKFDLDFSDLGYDASDHMSFGRNKVPVMFFFSGLHADYHRPSDTWDKLEPFETGMVLELVARVARRIDATDERPPYTPPPARNTRTASGRGGDNGQGGGYGPYFGSVPDFGQSENGVKFAEIREGSPAAKAGIKAGDVLIQFDGKNIGNLYDFTYALQAKKAGDEVEVTVLRNGQKVTASVKLTPRD